MKRAEQRRRLPVVEPALLCPSAQPGTEDAVVLGVIDHAAEPPTVQYLDQALPAEADVLAMAEPLLPTEVFRFAARCQESRCSHWDGRDCSLVTRIVELVPVATLALPPCRVRQDCRWYHQAGREACRRCPHVVTQNQEPSNEMLRAATPPAERARE